MSKPYVSSFFNVTMKVRVESDEWSPDGRKVLSEEILAAMRKTLEDEGPKMAVESLCEKTTIGACRGRGHT